MKEQIQIKLLAEDEFQDWWDLVLDTFPAAQRKDFLSNIVLAAQTEELARQGFIAGYMAGYELK